MRLVDSHAHLQSPQFADDLPEVLAAAELAGVERILVPGWDEGSSRRAIELAERFPRLAAAAGCHPHAAAETDAAAWRRIVALADHPAVVAIGETGLDYDRRFSPIEDQIVSLRRHLALALATGKPAILHCRSSAGSREAHDTLLAELRAAGFGGEASHAAFGDRPPAILHSVCGPVDHVAAALEIGCAVSVSGLCFRKGEEATAETVRLVPADRLLVETDAPYLSPPGAPRRRNEPAWARIVGAWVAEQRGERPEVVGAALVRAFDRVFARPTGVTGPDGARRLAAGGPTGGGDARAPPSTGHVSPAVPRRAAMTLAPRRPLCGVAMTRAAPMSLGPHQAATSPPAPQPRPVDLWRSRLPCGRRASRNRTRTRGWTAVDNAGQDR